MLNEKQVISKLKACKGFEEFFVGVSALKTHMDMRELKQFRKLLEKEEFGYSSSAIVYLCDCVDSEICVSAKQPIKLEEFRLKKEIIKNFDKLFPKIKIIQEEFVVQGIGRIDILGEEKDTKRPVIFELKIGARSPNQQLFAYAQRFDDPILVGITEEPIRFKAPEIQYYTYKSLGID